MSASFNATRLDLDFPAGRLRVEFAQRSDRAMVEWSFQIKIGRGQDLYIEGSFPDREPDDPEHSEACLKALLAAEVALDDVAGDLHAIANTMRAWPPGPKR